MPNALTADRVIAYCSLRLPSLLGAEFRLA